SSCSRSVNVEIVNTPSEILVLKKAKKSAAPEIRPVITQRKGDLFCYQEDADRREHPLNNGRRKVVGDHSQFKEPKNNLENTSDNYGQQENFIIAIRKNRCGYNGRKTGSRSGHTQRGTADDRNDDAAYNSRENTAIQRCASG